MAGDDDPYWCDDVDVWCWMGTEARWDRKMIRIPQVRGSVKHLLPKGCVAFCREGDKAWTRVES